MAYGILILQPGIKSVPPAVEAWSLNHWTTREVPLTIFFYGGLLNGHMSQETKSHHKALQGY